MAVTTYEVRIKTWNLDEDSDDFGMGSADTKEFFDKDEAYRCASFWTSVFDVCIRDGKKFHYKIEVMHIEYNTYKYSEGGR